MRLICISVRTKDVEYLFVCSFFGSQVNDSLLILWMLIVFEEATIKRRVINGTGSVRSWEEPGSGSTSEGISLLWEEHLYYKIWEEEDGHEIVANFVD